MRMEDICETLRLHRQSIGKRDLLQIEIAEAEDTLKIMQRTVAEDVAAPGAQNVTGMPKGNMVGNPTERLGLMLASGDAPRHIAQLKTDIAELKRELHDLTIRINRVAAWLAGLSERESWVITGHMVNGLTQVRSAAHAPFIAAFEAAGAAQDRTNGKIANVAVLSPPLSRKCHLYKRFEVC